MEIALLRTGGIIPMVKQAKEDVAWTESEMNELLDRIRIEGDAGKKRDGTSYQLLYNNETFTVDIDKVPAKYKKVFDRLKENLQIVKRSNL